jgi:mannonate dehydratase
MAASASRAEYELFLDLDTKMALEQNWRWFGPHDPITLEEIRQAGAVGIVTALHNIPIGEVWPVDEIIKRKQMIESAGLYWSAAESLPVHEDIKKRKGNYRRYIENYQQSVRNLGQHGVDTICYNFMPVLDWSRTDLKVVDKNDSITTGFRFTAFAAFDLFILKRKSARENYSNEQYENAQHYFQGLNTSQKDQLTATILLGLPGSLEAYSLAEFRRALDEYRTIGDVELRANLCDFIADIIPVALEVGVRLAIHPDDPPWSLLGLPRIVSNKQDIEQILGIIDTPANGLALCTGSLGASIENDLIDITESFAHRINFVHPRNVTRNADRDFTETHPLEGDIDLYSVLKALLLEQQRRLNEGRPDTHLPLRPDHGLLMKTEQNREGIYPGYSLQGRLRSLAELRGMELAIRRSLSLP